MTEGLEECLVAAGEGDPEAWRKLIEAYSPRVFGLIYRKCGDRELAEEITQATFVKVVKKLGDYRESGRFEAWLFRIAVNRLRDEMRRRQRQATPVDFTDTPPEAIGYTSVADNPEDAVHRKEEYEMLRKAVGRLPQADRELIELRYTAELTFAQIADMLEQPLGTVLARGHRALKKLRELLAEQMATDS